ncbi:uncharacterized protein sinu isoform X1 [Cloeon dipterum]|uniref:uncharacterized protein sinu isoform X1 n=2 Tax=Cloeon dipterum TaxID=197152 RepID=UPI003220685D
MALPKLRAAMVAKKRSLAGNCALAVFALTFICVFVAFCSPSWIVSDYRITGARLERFGLWAHCFRSLPDPTDEYQRRFFVGCRWIYDPFTTGYDKIRGFLLPPFIIATQFFYTVAFILTLIAFGLCLLYSLCCGPDQSRYVQLVRAIGLVLLSAGLCAAIAVVVFASLANRQGWMPGHRNNFFGWSFALAVAGVFASIVAGTLFIIETHIQQRKARDMKDSQARFSIEETKA